MTLKNKNKNKKPFSIIWKSEANYTHPHPLGTPHWLKQPWYLSAIPTVHDQSVLLWEKGDSTVTVLFIALTGGSHFLDCHVITLSPSSMNGSPSEDLPWNSAVILVMKTKRDVCWMNSFSRLCVNYVRHNSLHKNEGKSPENNHIVSLGRWILHFLPWSASKEACELLNSHRQEAEGNNKHAHWTAGLTTHFLLLTQSRLIPTLSKNIGQSRLRTVQTLRSSGTGLLYVPRTRIKHGEAAFSFYAPNIWNKLPENCRSAETLNAFKLRPKTFLFASAFY